jgi:diguanylate cyclase (GGDEF)-like protein/PAS domain S-box-containing protein
LIYCICAAVALVAVLAGVGFTLRIGWAGGFATFDLAGFAASLAVAAAALGVLAGGPLARRLQSAAGHSNDPQALLARLQQQAIDSTREALVITDAHSRVVSVNPAFTTITGYTAAQAIGCDPSFLASGRHDAAFFAEMWGALGRSGHWQGEIWNRRRNGELFPAWQTISCVRNAAGDVVNYVALFSDIGALKQAEERALHLAHHDMLTGLPNRLLFAAQLAHSLQRASRQRQQIALLFVDLDRFKFVNDTLGHAAGDELLRVVAARLRAAVRAEDTVARLGGDEFTVVLEEVAGAAAAAATALKLHDAIAAPMELQGRTVTVSATIGIALFPADGTDAGTLMRAADVAMYRAKRRGRRSHAFGGARSGGRRHGAGSNTEQVS